MTDSIYDSHLDQNPANYAALSPLSLLARAADVYPDRPSVIHGTKRFTWAQTAEQLHQVLKQVVR